MGSQEEQDAQIQNKVNADKSLNALVQKKQVVALDRDMKTKMLVTIRSEVSSQSHIVNPCASISCGPLQCPAGFTATKVEGHCCAYCVNPHVTVKAAVVGATGSSGGKAS